MYRIGIDLGGTNIVAAVVNEDYEIVARASCKTAIPRPAEAIVADMCAMSRQAVEKAGLTMEDIAMVGIGSPGTCNQESGLLEYANNLGFKNVPIQAMVSEDLGKPVYMANDADAAAFGEYLAGAGKGVKNCICVTLGTGVGGGIILDGKIYSGSNYAGGELGHMVIVAEGEPCTCGRRGCWEAYSSATGLINQTKAAMEANPDSALWQIAPTLEQVNGKTAFDGMHQGDPVATQVVERYIAMLGCGITNLVNIFQPDVICIGGGICNQGDTLILPLRAYVERERYSKYSVKQTAIVTTVLGNDAGIIGAAFLDRATNA